MYGIINVNVHWYEPQTLSVRCSVGKSGSQAYKGRLKPELNTTKYIVKLNCSQHCMLNKVQFLILVNVLDTVVCLASIIKIIKCFKLFFNVDIFEFINVTFFSRI